IDRLLAEQQVAEAVREVVARAGEAGLQTTEETTAIVFRYLGRRRGRCRVRLCLGAFTETEHRGEGTAEFDEKPMLSAKGRAVPPRGRASSVRSHDAIPVRTQRAQCRASTLPGSAS